MKERERLIGWLMFFGCDFSSSTMWDGEKEREVLYISVHIFMCSNVYICECVCTHVFFLLWWYVHMCIFVHIQRERTKQKKRLKLATWHRLTWCWKHDRIVCVIIPLKNFLSFQECCANHFVFQLSCASIPPFPNPQVNCYDRNHTPTLPMVSY